jgi:hypothetical protein
MKREGYEADKNDIIVDFKGVKMNLTANGTEQLTVFFGAKTAKSISLQLMVQNNYLK